MGTEYHKAFFTAAVDMVKTVVFPLNTELLAGIGGKAIQYHHPHVEHIEVYVEGAFEAAIAHPSAEETPG
jgi:hypothetical protein